jgi:hypothetical protein
MRQDNKQRNFKGFFCSLQQIDGSSVLVKLKNIIGMTDGDRKTFNTPFIYMGSTTHYNGFDLSLGLTKDQVKLMVRVQNTDIVGGVWSLQELSKRMNIKNGGVTKLIEDGRMGVKFNVRSKDHGTLWRVIITDDEREMKPIKTGKPVVSDYDDDFFFDL